MIYFHFCSLKSTLNFLQRTTNKPDFQEKLDRRLPFMNGQLARWVALTSRIVALTSRISETTIQTIRAPPLLRAPAGSADRLAAARPAADFVGARGRRVGVTLRTPTLRLFIAPQIPRVSLALLPNTSGRGSSFSPCAFGAIASDRSGLVFHSATFLTFQDKHPNF